MPADPAPENDTPPTPRAKPDPTGLAPDRSSGSPPADGQSGRGPAPRLPVPRATAGGALCRALVEAGADAVVAYTATDETEAMISGSVTAQIPPLLAGIHETLAQHGRTLDEHGRTLDEHTRILDEHTRILDEHTRVLGEHSRKLDEHSRKLDEHSRILDEHTRVLAEHSRKLDEHSRILDEHTRVLAEHGRKLDEHTRILAEHTRKLDEHGRILVRMDARLTVLEGDVRAVRELLETNLAANLAAIRTQFRLLWGALGLLVTVLIAVFGFLFVP